MKHLKRLAAVAAVAAVMPLAAAQAMAITWTFGGTVDWNNGGPTGQLLSGSLTLDESTFYSYTTDGVTFNRGLGLFNNPAWCPSCTPQQSNPLQVSGHATEGSMQLSVGGGSAWDRGVIALSRNSSGLNHYSAEGVSTDSNGIQRVIRIQTEDFLGAASLMFTDPNGGLALTQGINWFAPGGASRFEIMEFPTGGCCATINKGGWLTSVSIVPELDSSAMMLVGMGALWLTVRRRVSNIAYSESIRH